MKRVIVYTRPLCPYCVRAVALLRKKGAAVTEICAAFDADARAEMLKRSNGAATYPQIFIGDAHVGGCDDLYALEEAGKLGPMLNG